MRSTFPLPSGFCDCVVIVLSKGSYDAAVTLFLPVLLDV